MVNLRETEAEDTLDETLRETRIEELESDDGDSDYEDVPDFAPGVPFPGKPTLQKTAWQKALPLWLQPETFNLFHDDLETETSEKQKTTTEECLALLRDPSTLGLPLNSHGIPYLNREKHIKFLEAWLGPFPEPYVAMDASRPWVFYWTMAGLSFLGQDVSRYKERLMETVKPLQHPDGGFGGGHGQLAHCAGTYATLLALAAVDGLEVVNRKTMWHFLGQVKQPSGGFRMAIGGEEDVRGAYCALTALTLLNLPLDLPPDSPARQAGLTTFLDGLGTWISRCQTYEGGIGGAPDGEAHGAYAFCALACLSLMDAPNLSIPKYLDTSTLTTWLSHTQTTPEGGFAGRTNKLVDACYSHWLGGCWSLLQASLFPTAPPTELWNREALIRYLLTCSQPAGKKGGMRDKPSVRADAYHTCYSLSGLSAATNTYVYDTAKLTRDAKTGRLEAAFNWRAAGPKEEEWAKLLVDREDLVVPVHPVFVLTMESVERARERFAKGGF